MSFQKLRIAIYIRVSTQEQATHGYSIEEQEERAKKYCEAMGWSVYKVYRDAGFSGGDTKRPALQQMIKDIKARKIDKVLVYKLDRLSRSQKDTLTLIEDDFLANNVDFVSMSENFDTSTAFGRAMVGILAVFAQLEREQIKERMAMGKDARAKEGKWGGGAKTPIGYDYINDELITNEYEKMQIQMLFDYYASGLSAWKIAQKMTESGYSHKYGQWNADRVRLALGNRLYLGYIKHHDEWYKGSHEAFVDEKLFDRVNEMIKKRSLEHRALNARMGKATSYLAGYISCSCCGARYQKLTANRTCRGKKYHYEYYQCSSRTKKKRSLVKDENCKNKGWKMADLDNLIFGEIRKLAVDPNYIAEIKSENTDDEKSRILASEIKKLEEQIARVMDLYTIGQIPLDILQDKIYALNEKKTKLENELAEISNEEERKMSKDNAIQLAQSFGDILDRGDFDEIRSVIGALIEKIEINGDDITVYWAFA